MNFPSRSFWKFSVKLVLTADGHVKTRLLMHTHTYKQKLFVSLSPHVNKTQRPRIYALRFLSLFAKTHTQPAECHLVSVVARSKLLTFRPVQTTVFVSVRDICFSQNETNSS